MGRMVYVANMYINTDDINVITVNDKKGEVIMRGGKKYECTREEADAAAGRGVIKDVIYLEHPVHLRRKDKNGAYINIFVNVAVVDYTGGFYYLTTDEAGGKPVLIPVSRRAETNTYRWPEKPIVIPRMAKDVYEKVKDTKN